MLKREGSPCESCSVESCAWPCERCKAYIKQHQVKAGRVVTVAPIEGLAEWQTKRIEAILDDVVRELVFNAMKKHPTMDGIDEGYGTMRCEVAELKREIDRRTPSDSETRKENVQVAATAIRMLNDCYDNEGKVIR
jgi:nitrous oxide reductase